MMDVVYKIANFYHQADAVLPEFYAAEGIEKTQEELDREAADIVNRTNVTYKRAAPFIRTLEKMGGTNFGTFFYEVFRTQVNNMKQGFDELKRAQQATTPEGAATMRAQGARRVLGQLTVWAGLAKLSQYLGALTFGDDDEKEKKLRMGMPDYMRYKDFVKVGTDEKGDPVLFDVSRIDPMGPMTDMMRTAINGDADLDKIKDNIYQLYVAPRIGARAFELGMVLADKKDKVSKPLTQELLPDAYAKMLTGIYKTAGVENTTTKAATRVAETYLPGITSSWKESNVRPVMEDWATAVPAAMTYMGATMYKVDGKRNLEARAYDYKDLVKDNNRVLKEAFTDNPNMSADEMVERMSDRKAMEQEAFDKMHEVYEGMVANGTPPREISVALKAAGLSAETIRDLHAGRFVFRSASANSVDTAMKKELAKLKGEEKAEAQKKWNEYKAMLRMSKEQLKDTE